MASKQEHTFHQYSITMYVYIIRTYHVGPCLKDLDWTEIHKLLDDDFEHVQTNVVFVMIGMKLFLFAHWYVCVCVSVCLCVHHRGH